MQRKQQNIITDENLDTLSGNVAGTVQSRMLSPSVQSSADVRMPFQYQNDSNLNNI